MSISHGSSLSENVVKIDAASNTAMTSYRRNQAVHEKYTVHKIGKEKKVGGKEGKERGGRGGRGQKVGHQREEEKKVRQ